MSESDDLGDIHPTKPTSASYHLSRPSDHDEEDDSQLVVSNPGDVPQSHLLCPRKSELGPSSSCPPQVSTIPAEEDSCLICMLPGDLHNPLMELPCASEAGKCKSNRVHGPCIFEWGERSVEKSKAYSCPLCRGPLVESALTECTPKDVLNVAMLQTKAARGAFVMMPLDPRWGTCRFVFRVMKPDHPKAFSSLEVFFRYTFALQKPMGKMSYPRGPLPNRSGEPTEGEVLLMSSRKVGGIFGLGSTTLEVLVGTNSPKTRQFDRVGLLKSSFSRLEYDFLGVQGEDFGHASFKSVAAPNGMTQRNLRIALPGVSCQSSENQDQLQTGWTTNTKIVTNRMDKLASILHSRTPEARAVEREALLFKSRHPVYSGQVYSLDFKGRATKHSMKNFQLMKGFESNGDSSNAYPVALQMGKTSTHRGVYVLSQFTVDFAWPLSPYQAFAIALATHEANR